MSQDAPERAQQIHSRQARNGGKRRLRKPGHSHRGPVGERPFLYSVSAEMSRRPVLLAQPYYLAHDPKQVRKMRPYPPLATLITASVLRQAGKDVALFDAMLSP